MSFILDALKKSETDRQRQNGPALFEVRAAPTRDKLPLWAVGLGVLLAVNLVIVAWVLLHRPASAESAQPAAAGMQQSGQGPYEAGAGPMSGPQGQQRQGWGQGGQGQQQGWGAQGPGGQGPQGQGIQGQGMQAQGMPQGHGQQGPGMQQGAAMPQGASGGGPAGYGAPANGGYGAPAYGAPPAGPMAQTAGLTAGQQPGMTQQPGMAPANGQAYTGPQQPGGNTAPVAGNDPSQGGEKLNPDDYAPAADPAPQPFGNHVTRGTSSGVPLYNDVAATTRLPSLRLDLHVYAANPQERFVMINMHKLHEGDLMTSEGVRVENITPFGAVLSRDGTKFLLPRD
jgi:general secretion pathway protein B